jgi:hypothetical protein
MDPSARLVRPALESLEAAFDPAPEALHAVPVTVLDDRRPRACLPRSIGTSSCPPV